jgi:hypothetical protein
LPESGVKATKNLNFWIVEGRTGYSSLLVSYVALGLSIIGETDLGVLISLERR